MRRILVAMVTILLTSLATAQESPRSVPAGAGRPNTPGITRTTLNDTSKASVIRVRFDPGAREVPHTHPYDIVVIPISAGKARFVNGNKTTDRMTVGDAQLVAQGVVHYLVNQDTKPLEVITVALK